MTTLPRPTTIHVRGDVPICGACGADNMRCLRNGIIVRRGDDIAHGDLFGCRCGVTHLDCNRWVYDPDRKADLDITEASADAIVDPYYGGQR